MPGVDWGRVAVPQKDGYDTGIVERLAGEPAGHPGAGVPWFAVSPAYAGRVDFRRDFGRFADADPGHPNVVRAVQLVDLWPVGAAQARRLIRVLHAGLDPVAAPDVGSETIATASHSYDDAFGTMWATVNSALGLAEAIVHEMAHHKLRACGVRFERAERIVANPPGERYPSALLGGRRRPMPAVVHAQYALLHMVALKLAVLAAGPPAVERLARTLLRRDVRTIRAGADVIRRSLVVDRCGAEFMPAVWRWQSRLLAESEHA